MVMVVVAASPLYGGAWRAVAAMVVMVVVKVVLLCKRRVFLVGCRWLPRASGTKKYLKSTYGYLNGPLKAGASGPEASPGPAAATAWRRPRPL